MFNISSPSIRKALAGVGISTLLVVSGVIGALVLKPMDTRVLTASSQVNTSATDKTVAGQDETQPSLASQYANIPGITVLRERDLGTWRYIITNNETNGVSGGVVYKHDTVNDISAYIAANRALIPEVAAAGGRAEVTISFLPLAEAKWFREWARQKGLRATQTQILIAAPGSTGTGTMIILGKGDDPVPQADLDSAMINGIYGIHGVYGTVDASRLSEIASDPNVALLDVTPAWVRLDTKRSGVANLDSQPVAVDLPYGYMEKLGLQNFANAEAPMLPTIPLPVITPPIQHATIVPDN